MNKPFFLRVSSQKGGVGKTTIAVNLATALGLLNYKVLLVDSDVISPAVSFFLGIEEVNIGVSEVMDGKAPLKRVIVRHDVSGIDILPGTQTPRDYPSQEEMTNLIKKITAEGDYDFVVVDTPPGYTPSAVPELYNEALIISTPAMASVASSIRLSNIYDKHRLQHNLIINRVRGTKYELSAAEIESGYDGKSIVSIPEDPKVAFGESSHIPLMVMDPKAPFSMSMNILVRFYAAKKGASMARITEPKKGALSSILDVIRKFFRI